MSIDTFFDNNSSLNFINIYSKDNPILETGDECYFLLFNSVDFHIPIICKGIIVHDNFNDVINKKYYITLTEIIETDENINKYFLSKQIPLYQYKLDSTNNVSSVSVKSKYHRFESLNIDRIRKYFEKHLYKTESFFVRTNYEAIKKLKRDYCNIIKQDLNKQISEIDSLF